jgi:hypothetical protein
LVAKAASVGGRLTPNLDACAVDDVSSTVLNSKVVSCHGHGCGASVLQVGRLRIDAEQPGELALSLPHVRHLESGAALRIEPKAIAQRCHQSRLLPGNSDPRALNSGAALALVDPNEVRIADDEGRLFVDRPRCAEGGEDETVQRGVNIRRHVRLDDLDAAASVVGQMLRDKRRAEGLDARFLDQPAAGIAVQAVDFGSPSPGRIWN